MIPKILILTGYGINCEEETAFGFERAGGESRIIHVNDLIAGDVKMSDFQVLAIPGGFSYGDDTGSGNALANRIKNNLGEAMMNFVRSDKLVIGICNGLQVLVNLGLVPALDLHYTERQTAIDRNDSARLQDRWVWLKNVSGKCIFTKGIKRLHVPIAHGEGKFTAPKTILEQMKKNDQIVFQYVKEDGAPAQGKFPFNPNGALMDIAGISDPTGRIFGMMPHPERFLEVTNEDGWNLKKENARKKGIKMPKEGDGLLIFRNAVGYFQ